MLAVVASSARGGRSSAATTAASSRRRCGSDAGADISLDSWGRAKRKVYCGDHGEHVRDAREAPCRAARAGRDARRGDEEPARGDRRRTQAAHQARRRDWLCVRRQQGPEDAAGGGRGAARRRGHADHERRRAIEPRPRHRGGRGGTGAALRAGGEWGTASRALRQRAARPAPRRGGSSRRDAPGARPGGRGRRSGDHECRRSAVRHSDRGVDAARSRRVCARGRRAAAADGSPDVIVHSTSSGGTQAGLVAGCAMAGVATRVLGISADEAAPVLAADIRRIVDGRVRAGPTYRGATSPSKSTIGSSARATASRRRSRATRWR